jgi:hypothetical protein
MPEPARAFTALQVLLIRPIIKAMDTSLLNPDSISIPRWTIKRDSRSSGCLFCGSIIVCVTTDTRQMAFCSCRLLEYRLLPRPNQRKPNPAPKH